MRLHGHKFISASVRPYRTARLEGLPHADAFEAAARSLSGLVSIEGGDTSADAINACTLDHLKFASRTQHRWFWKGIPIGDQDAAVFSRRVS